MRGWLTSSAEILGAGAVAFGFGMMWLPLGIIAAGASMVTFGYRAGD